MSTLQNALQDTQDPQEEREVIQNALQGYYTGRVHMSIDDIINAINTWAVWYVVNSECDIIERECEL